MRDELAASRRISARVRESSRAAPRRGTIRIALGEGTAPLAMNHAATLKVNGRNNFLIVSELACARARASRLPERASHVSRFRARTCR